MTRGRVRTPRPRPRAVVATVAAVLVAVAAVGYAVRGSAPHGAPASPSAAAGTLGFTQQVLGGKRVAGLPSVQRFTHDGIVFTVTVAPSLPGPNLVRVDTASASSASASAEHAGHGADPQVRVGIGDALSPARQLPGTDGRWAVVDLPAGSATLLVTHGSHRLPVSVVTGDGARAGAVWAGPDGPECLLAATGALLAGGGATGSCPSDGLTREDATTLRSLVGTLAGRGVRELAVDHDRSTRGREAWAVVRKAAGAAGLRTVAPDDPPGDRDALLVLTGWSDAAEHLAATSRLPARQQPMRTDGTWLAPWLLTPGVVDSTSGAMIPLDFDIRSEAAQRYSQTLAKYLPGQAPTGPGYRAWRSALGEDPDPVLLFAASRTAYMPAQPGHGAHETTVAWFPGGTVTPVGRLAG